MMLISSEHLIILFHLVDADSISFAQSSTTNARTARAPYSGNPIAVVIEAAAPFVVTDATALTNAADAIDINILSCPYSLSVYIPFLVSDGIIVIFVILFVPDSISIHNYL
ncbi:MAG: hypothetical protein A4E24_00172 [Methanomethylovorans sp. PtaU1.Bin093]|nr:MAG: hypothetical protein A4E24_00172 [Methanomethylovorans sp. PtaU1.Bin093]